MCIGCPGNTSIFGNTSQYIKIQGSDFVAIEGVNTVERLLGGDIRIPYKQLLKSRVILKAGQANYLLNHLGLGDNATFLAIKATYNTKSVNEEDNYVDYYFYDDLASRHSFNQLIVLTGNSQNRIQQLYLTNPNSKYAVVLDIMVAVIDEEYSFFNDVLNQSGTSFVGLAVTDIHSYVVGESIVINDKNSKPLIYLLLVNISSIEKDGDVITIDDTSLGFILLKFSTDYDANQAFSLLNYILENQNVDIDSLVPLTDDVSPVIYFNSEVGGTGDYIEFNGSTASLPYDTSFGNTFSTTISISTYGNGGLLTKTNLIDLLIDVVDDDRDGIISLTSSNINIFNYSQASVSSITSTGTYSLSFEISDIAENNLSGVTFSLIITT
jgi:hypothetical protein